MRGSRLKNLSCTKTALRILYSKGCRFTYDLILRLLRSRTKCVFGNLELVKQLADRNFSSDSVAINTAANFFAVQIVNPEHGIAAKIFVESFVLRWIAKSVDEHRDEISRSRNDFVVNKRTACKATTAGSSRVFTEV